MNIMREPTRHIEPCSTCGALPRDVHLMRGDPQRHLLMAPGLY